MTDALDRMHGAMAGWPGRALKPASRVQGPTCETCRYWTGRATWRTVAHFLTLGFWQAPEWGLCRSRLSHHARSKTWSLMGCRRWRVELRKGGAEPSDADVARDLVGQRQAELAGEVYGLSWQAIMLGVVLFAAAAGGAWLVAAAIVHGAGR